MYKLAGNEPHRDETGKTILIDRRTENKDKEHHNDHLVTEARIEQWYRLHAADKHQRQETDQARPNNINKDPSIEQTEEDPDQVHTQWRKRRHSRQLAEAKNNDQ